MGPHSYSSLGKPETAFIHYYQHMQVLPYKGLALEKCLVRPVIMISHFFSLSDKSHRIPGLRISPVAGQPVLNIRRRHSPLPSSTSRNPIRLRVFQPYFLRGSKIVSVNGTNLKEEYVSFEQPASFLVHAVDPGDARKPL
jgi:hypothetical protein